VSSSTPVVFITSPLEVEHVERIRTVAGDRAAVEYHPDLLPPTRYVGDHNGEAGFRRTDQQVRRWREILARAEILWDFPAGVTSAQELAELVPNLRWVQTTSAGVGQLVHRLGYQGSDLLVTTASGVHAVPLAEFVFLTLLAHVKLLPRIQRDQLDHRWIRYCSDDLEGKTMAIIGPGRIGQRVAHLARAFGMRVSAMGRRSDPERARELGVDRLFPRAGMYEMLSEADAVVLCCPHTPETENLIDATAFDAMKDGVVFVNISRGQVVVEDALYNALTSGKIGFAGLDVFRTEPLPPDSPLWDLPNVMVCPHSASTSFAENGKITEIFCHNLERYLDGRFAEMRNLLGISRMY
jgi:phosphoglycerate dehydrogenase-like enzyme